MSAGKEIYIHNKSPLIKKYLISGGFNFVYAPHPRYTFDPESVSKTFLVRLSYILLSAESADILSGELVRRLPILSA